jgi:transcriptional regulator with XRE-family HTH domain
MMLLASTSPPVDPIEVTASTLNELGELALINRIDLDLSVTQAAEQVGVGAGTYSGLEAGTSNPTRATIVAVLRWLAA